MSINSDCNDKETQAIKMIFPWKLHELLKQVEEKNHNDIISWSVDGKSFIVHDKERFTEEVMPKYFVIREERTTSVKFKTFQRSLNLWGFKCISRRDDTGVKGDSICYAHSCFNRENPDLCLTMQRVRVKGMRRRPSVRKPSDTTTTRKASAQKSTMSRSNSSNAKKTVKTMSGDIENQIPSGMIKSVTITNKKNKKNKKNDSVKETKILNEIFPWKLHGLLQQMDDQNQNDIISWSSDGKSFIVYDKERLFQEIMPNFLVVREETCTTTKFKTFQRSLKRWGFKFCSSKDVNSI